MDTSVLLDDGHHVDAAGLEFITLKPKAVDKECPHGVDFFLFRGSGKVLEENPLGGDCPSADCEAELDVCFDLSSMESGVEQAELDGPLAEECMQVEPVVSGGIIVRVVDPSAVVVVCFAVPDPLDIGEGFVLLFDCIPEGNGDFSAPAMCSCVVIECIVDEVLPCYEEFCEIEKGVRCVVCPIDVDVDSTAFIYTGSCFFEFPDDCLELRDIFVSKDRGDKLH